LGNFIQKPKLSYKFIKRKKVNRNREYCIEIKMWGKCGENEITYTKIPKPESKQNHGIYFIHPQRGRRIKSEKLKIKN
jgi:hypothetical protein